MNNAIFRMVLILLIIVLSLMGQIDEEQSKKLMRIVQDSESKIENLIGSNTTSPSRSGSNNNNFEDQPLTQ